VLLRQSPKNARHRLPEVHGILKEKHEETNQYKSVQLWQAAAGYSGKALKSQPLPARASL